MIVSSFIFFESFLGNLALCGTFNNLRTDKWRKCKAKWPSKPVFSCEILRLIFWISYELTHNFTARLLLRRQISLRAFSYSAQFHSAHSLTALNLIPRIVLQRLMPLFECLIIYVRHGTTLPPFLALIPPPSTFQLVAWGHGSPSPWPQSSPPPQHWRSAEKSMDGILELCGGGGVCARGQAPPPSPFPLHHCRSPFQLVAWGRGCKRSSSTLSNEQFIQKHRGGNSNLQYVD